MIMDNIILYKFFDNKSSIEDEIALFAWLDESPENHKIMLRERKIYDSILLSSDSSMKSKIERRKLSLIPAWTKEVVRYAAVLLLFAGGAWMYVDVKEKSYSELIHTVSVPAGHRVNIALPDGTKVTLNSLSELRYPSNFSNDKRVVELDGEAYFEVELNESSPFIVNTQLCGVEVLGTVFNVEAYDDKGEFKTSLISGRVVVRNNVGEHKSITLNANQEVVFRNNEFIVSIMDDVSKFLWRDGILAFKESPFSLLISNAERHFGVEINILNDDIREKVISGKIRLSDGIDHYLRVLQTFEYFNYVWNEDRSVIDIY